MNDSPSRRDALKQLILVPAAASMLSNKSAWADDKPADPYADAVLIDGPPPVPNQGSFTIAVLPDTQNYSEKFPEHFTAQTKWIVENKAKYSIVCVQHLGDVTNRNSQAEWTNAQSAMSLLDGNLPYFMVPGNHDYSEGGACTNRDCGLTEAFPISKFRSLKTFGGTYDREPNRTENSFHLFSAGGRELMSMCLEFGPRKDVVRWANEVAAQHQNREIILSTHAYMYYDDTRYSWKTFGNKQSWNPHSYPVAKNTNDDVCDGEDLWNLLVSQHQNFILTLNGHVLGDGLGRMVSTTPNQRDVHQVLVNYQMRPNGGDGWLRLLEFQRDSKTVQVYDYSPTLNKRNESPQNQFPMKLA